MTKKLYATTDFYDEVYHSNRLYEKRHIEALMDYLRGLGVGRLDWTIKQTALHERDYPGGFDLLGYVAQAAHARGIELHAVFKPFEGGFGFGLPHSFPRPVGAVLLDDLRGPLPVVDPFVVDNPHLRFRRRPGNWNPLTPLTSIHLIKGDAAPTRIRKEHLSIWTSARNNEYTRYEGDFTFDESIEWRRGFPVHYQARVLSLGGLNIPADRRYLQVRCSRADEHGDFTNRQYDLVELLDDRGEVIPCTPGCPPPKDLKAHMHRFAVWRLINAYFRLPEVARLLDDAQAVVEQFRDYCSYDVSTYCEGIDPDKPYTLDRRGMVAVARGKDEYLPGALHPVYPQVQEYWLSWVRFCIDHGADGVNFRACNHSDRSHEKSEYGFNAPLLEQCGGRLDRDAVARTAGEAYTTFLARARDELKRRGRSITVHVDADLLAPDARSLHNSPLPPNVDWQWERWIREIADVVEIRGLFRLRRPEHDFVVDRVSRVCREAGKPVIYQSTIKEVSQVMKTGEGPRLAWEMEYVRRHPRVDAYRLYETASFACLREDGEFQGSDHLAELVRRHL